MDEAAIAVLEALGVDAGVIAEMCEDPTKLRVACVPASLATGLGALGGSTRDHVVMARVDDDTLERLDAWVATGAVRSRSEAAALFIAEGLRLREPEFQDLREAVADLQDAQRALRERAAKLLGSENGGGEDTDA